MSNIQVTHDSSPSNARSESCIAINPNNPMQIVCASKKFSDIQNYIFTLATAFSTDGGFSWHDAPDLALRAFPDKIDHIPSWSGMQRIRIGRSWSETRRWPRISYRRCTPLA